MSLIPFDALEALADRQAGALATWQLRLLGLSESHQRRLPSRFGWTPLHRGVWRVMASAPSSRQKIWAAVLATTTPPTDPGHSWEEVYGAARTGAVVTGLSAAWLRSVIDIAPTVPQLLIPHTTRRLVPGVRVVRTRFEPVESCLVAGLPVSLPLRMFWDIAWISRSERDMVPAIIRWMSTADGLRLLKAKDIHMVLPDPVGAGLPRNLPTSFRLAAIRLAQGHSHSGSEHRGRAIITEIGKSLGLHVEPRPLALPDETEPIAEADVAIPAIRFDAEIDGPHHDEPEQRRRDRYRDDLVRQTLDWTIRRYRTEFVNTDEARFRRVVEADIHQGAAAVGVLLPVRRAA